MFSEEQLKQLIEGKSVGEKYPYNTNNEEEIEAHIRRLYYRLKQIPNLIVEAEWDHFGSGYASFVDFFCYLKEDVKSEDDPYGNRHIEMDGIIVDICRLAPVAIMGEDDRHKTIRIETNEAVSGGRGLLSSPNALVISEKYQLLAEKIIQTLE